MLHHILFEFLHTLLRRIFQAFLRGTSRESRQYFDYTLDKPHEFSNRIFRLSTLPLLSKFLHLAKLIQKRALQNNLLRYILHVIHFEV